MKRKMEKKILVIFQRVPDRFLPSRFKDYLGEIAEREIQEVKAEIIRMQWQKIKMERELNYLKENRPVEQ